VRKKLLLSIFVLMSLIVFNFFTGSKVDAAVTVNMDWYDQQTDSYVNKPTKAQAQAFLASHTTDRIYLIRTYDGLSTTVPYTPKLSMRLISMPIAVTLTMSTKPAFTPWDGVNKQIVFTFSPRYYDSGLGIYRTNVAGNFSILFPNGLTTNTTNTTVLPSPSQIQDSTSNYLYEVKTTFPTGSSQGDLFPFPTEIDITRAVFGDDANLGPTLELIPYTNQLYGNPISTPVSLRSNYYQHLSITVDGLYRDTYPTGNSTASAVNTDITQIIKDSITTEGSHQIYVKAFRTLDKSDTPDIKTFTVRYSFEKPVEPVDPEPDGDLPVQPSAPDSSWDLVGWIKYLIDWVIYLVNVLIFLLSKVGTSIGKIVTSSGTFIAVLGSFFSFLPAEVTAVLVLGVSIAVILRFVAR